MTSSTKPEVHNVLHCRDSWTQPWLQLSSRENFVKFGRVVFFGRPLRVTVRPMKIFISPECYGTVVLSLTLVYYGIGVGWIKMSLGTEVGLGRGDIVLDGNPAPLGKGHSSPSPLFAPRLLWPNGRPSQQLLSSC